MSMLTELLLQNVANINTFVSGELKKVQSDMLNRINTTTSEIQNTIENLPS